MSSGERGLLGSNNGRQWVITTNTNAHNYPPENNDTSNSDGRRGGRKCLSESSENDDNQFKTVHPLTTDEISEDTETNLTNDSS